MHRLRTFLLAAIFLSRIWSGGIPLLAQSGISGSIDMDRSVWTPIAYLSIITDFNEMYTMSYGTIVERSIIDESGSYSFSTAMLPQEDHLYRIHFSKKGDPPASLIIGSREENHFFILANRESNIDIKSGRGNNLVNDLSFSGYYPNRALLEVNRIADYLDTLDYGTNVNREFISNAVREELRLYADTCSHPLVSLYALYQSSFESDYTLNPKFYKKYVRKWRKEDSEYFRVFKSQLDMEGTSGSILAILLIVVIIALPVAIFLLRQKAKEGKSPISQLTVQERRIFSMLQQGMSNKEIADELGVSLSTVKSHVNNIYSKLNISSRKEVMDYK